MLKVFFLKVSALLEHDCLVRYFFLNNGVIKKLEKTVELPAVQEEISRYGLVVISFRGMKVEEKQTDILDL